MTSFSFLIERLLWKLGFNDMQAISKTRKLYNFESWLKRHSITNMVVMLPTDMPNDKWVNVEASMDDMKLTSVTGKWRKHYTWSAMARVKKT